MCSRLGRLALEILQRLHRLICSQSLLVGKLTPGLHYVPRLENSSTHAGLNKKMLQFIMEHENILLPRLALKLIQKPQQLQDTVALFPTESGWEMVS